ncbi:MAG: hypothetical protein HYZ42_01420 [Bacteroidetes bacterium]|nr:hypothetical protein [Bacteroidota bacterium]
MYKSFVKLLIVLAIIFFNHVTKAQDSAKVKPKIQLVYINYGIGSSMNGNLLVGLGVNLMLNNHLGIALTYNSRLNTASELPGNYKTGLFSAELSDYLDSYSIKLVKEFPSSYKMFRCGVEGGLSIVQYRTAHFTYIPSTGFLESNYETNYTKQNTVGLSLRARASIPVFRLLGVELAAVSNINPIKSYIGGELHIILGLVRQKID